ncbi:hypothetical protein Hdeb2414_s0018g00531801 [Helianthus debilis subsp. tardiflorus]
MTRTLLIIKCGDFLCQDLLVTGFMSMTFPRQPRSFGRDVRSVPGHCVS